MNALNGLFDPHIAAALSVIADAIDLARDGDCTCPVCTQLWAAMEVIDQTPNGAYSWATAARNQLKSNPDEGAAHE